jgi:hypothetical protein
MADTLDGGALTANSVTEAKLVTSFTNKVTNAYNAANTANAAAANAILSTGATITGNLIISAATGRLGVGISPNTLLHVNGTSTLGEVIEKINVSATGMGSTLNFDVLTQPILYFTSAATANCALNFRGNTTVAMETFLRTGQAITVSLLTTYTSTGYAISTVSVDSVVQTVKWAGNSPPVVGANFSVDMYTFTIVKTGTAAYTVFGSQQRYG